MSKHELPASEGHLTVDWLHEVPLLRFASMAAGGELVHAVSTRMGGVSAPPYDTLNLSWTTGDDFRAVEENHRRLCSALGLAPSSLVSPRQAHGCNVRAVGAADRGSIIPDCDALITDEPGVALLLRFADCVPIMIWDAQHRAIGLAHAGWRGTVAGIASATVRRMQAEYGSRPGELVAALGPAIGPCCYVVGADVIGAVRQALGDTNGLLHVGPRRRPEGVGEAFVSLDLWETNRRALAATGIRSIEVSGICTSCHNDRFFSYRAGNGQTGHHGAIMCLQA